MAMKRRPSRTDEDACAARRRPLRLSLRAVLRPGGCAVKLRLAVRIGLLLLYAGLIALTFLTGKWHTRDC